jgi:hypothetical protein
VLDTIAKKSRFWYLEKGFTMFDALLTALSALPHMHVPGMVQMALAAVGVPRYLIQPCCVLLNPDVRSLCARISTQLRQIIAAWKTNGDYRSAIIHLIEVVLESQLDSAEKRGILNEVAELLDEQADREHKSKGCVALTKRAISLLPQFTALDGTGQQYAEMGLNLILPMIFDRLLPEDRADVAPESDQPVVGGGGGQVVAGGGGGQVVVGEGASHAGLGQAAMTLIRNAAALVTQVVPPELQQQALSTIVDRAPISERSKKLVDALLSLVFFLPGETHIGLRMYEFLSLDHRHGFLCLEVGAMNMHELQFIHTLAPALLLRTSQSRAVFQTATEPHIKRLVDQSAACDSASQCLCDGSGNAPSVAVNIGAVRFQIMANVHYLFHHEVCCFLRLYSVSIHCLIDFVNITSCSASICQPLTACAVSFSVL